jgi:hypothetical protein
VANIQDRIDILEDAFGWECHCAALGRYEPDYEMLGRVYNEVVALLEQRDKRGMLQ